MTTVGISSRIASEPGTPAAAGSQPADRSKPSLNALTGLRFLAAMGVVFFHFSQPILQGRSYILFNLAGSGYIAVDLFYLLSGFILAYSYLSPEGKLLGSRRNFYVSRFARIYPAYFLAFILAAPSDISTSLHVNHLATAVAKLAISAGSVLTLQQAWTPWTAWDWNYPAWSVSVEVFFYLLFPWLAIRLARVKQTSALPLAGLFWLLGLVAPFVLWALKGATGQPSKADHLQMAIEFTPIFRLPEFAIGILLGRAYVLGRFRRLNGSLLATTAFVSIFAVLAFCPKLPHPLLANGLLAPLFALLIVSLAQAKGPIAWFLALPFMVTLGEASYGIYILQIPLALLINRPPPYHSIRVLFIYCALLVVCSVVSWRFVESPLRKNIRRWLSKTADYAPCPSAR
jgi:peptidoglycan/LPS O-acetylase OafA/YrhL